MEVDRVYHLQNLCEILGIDLKQKILEEVDSSIDNPNEWIEKSQSLDEMTTKRLSGVVERLSQLKLQRFSQVKKMGSLILLYWITLSTPANDQQDLINLFYFMDLDSADELKEPNSLSLAFIDIVEKEFNKLAQQLDDLVLKKKAKLKRLFEMTHLEYNFADTGISDSLIALADVRLQISQAKAQVSKRQDIVTRILFLQHANNEIQLQKDGVFEDDDKRTMKAKILMNIFPKMLNKAEDMVADWNADAEQPFEFDGVDVRVILENFDASYKEAMQPEDVYRIPSPPLRFGRTAPRTRRVPVQALPPAARSTQHATATEPTRF